jgi:hypothetical protein
MADSKLVQIKVESDRLEAWDKFHSESPEFDDRSDLVRKSVERTISTDSKEQDTQDGIGRAEALEQFERLEGLLNDVEREVNLVQQDIVTEETMDDIVLQRTFQSTKRVLENAGIVGEEDDSK